MLSKKDKKAYMKIYNKCYQKALNLLRKAHMTEFYEIFSKLMSKEKGVKNGKKN